MAEESILQLNIGVTGPPHARRYYVLRDNGQAWGSDGWTHDVGRAELHSTLLQCYQAIRDIEEHEMAGKKYRDFVVPLAIRVYTDEEMDHSELRMYMEKACRMAFDYEACGRGPGSASMIHLGAIWSQLKEIDKET